MAKLIYSMISSLDGYTEDAQGRFGWGAPDDAELLAYINALSASLGTHLYGRRMYETMVYWETVPDTGEQSAEEREYARLWKAMRKIVFSHQLPAVRSANTTLERSFDAAAVRRLVDDSPEDVSVNGPGLAAQALAAGIVDEIHTIQCPVLVGGGTRFFPNGVALSLALLDSRSFSSGVVTSRYAVAR